MQIFFNAIIVEFGISCLLSNNSSREVLCDEVIIDESANLSSTAFSNVSSVGRRLAARSGGSSVVDIETVDVDECLNPR